MHDMASSQDEPTWPSPWVRRLFPPLDTVAFGASARVPVSIVVLAKDEERCIARCLDSVVDRGFTTVLVVDTGSTDTTLDIVTGYRDRGVQLIELPWPGSFGAARNFAIRAVSAGWVVFLDADEWLTERSSEQLGSCLTSLSGITDVTSLVFVPLIFDVDRGVHDDGIPRILRADSDIRFRGPVHEYPVISGATDSPVGVVGIDIEFRHDGYTRAVVDTKRKRERNLALLEAARADDPDNPRWLYYTIRDALPVLDRTQIIDLCTSLQGLVDSSAKTGDLLGARTYCRLGLSFACQGLAAMGDWPTVYQYCDELDRLDGRASPDAHYFRMMSELLHGVTTNRDLLQTIRLRNDEDVVADSAIDPTGIHLDALIIALLAKVRGPADAIAYQDLCPPWTDVFFENSTLRATHAHL